MFANNPILRASSGYPQNRDRNNLIERVETERNKDVVVQPGTHGSAPVIGLRNRAQNMGISTGRPSVMQVPGRGNNSFT